MVPVLRSEHHWSKTLTRPNFKLFFGVQAEKDRFEYFFVFVSDCQEDGRSVFRDIAVIVERISIVLEHILDTLTLVV